MGAGKSVVIPTKLEEGSPELGGGSGQGDKAGTGHTCEISLDRAQRSPVAPKEKNMGSDFRGTNIRTLGPQNLRPLEDSGEASAFHTPVYLSSTKGWPP